jgi:hypothetical protein
MNALLARRAVKRARAAIGRASEYRARGWHEVAAISLDVAASERRLAAVYRDLPHTRLGVWQ